MKLLERLFRFSVSIEVIKLLTLAVTIVQAVCEIIGKEVFAV